jgi:Zn-dependent protease
METPRDFSEGSELDRRPETGVDGELWEPEAEPVDPDGQEPMVPCDSTIESDDVAPVEPEADIEAAIEEARPGELDVEKWRGECREMLGLVSTRKPSGSGGSLFLLITMGLFAASFLGRFSVRTIVLLVAACLIHELGHLAGMKLFGYRDLKVFFIPFFGAAASGKNIQAPKWQRATVLLLGPLPGLVLGMVLALTAVWFPAKWLSELAVVILVLNGFNLLPFMPLDGGRFLNEVLFSRNRMIEAAFGVFAALGLAAIGWLSGDYLIGGLGVFWLLLVPTGYQTRKLAESARGLSLPRVEALAMLPEAGLVRLYGIVRKRYLRLRSKTVPKTLMGVMEVVYEKAMQASASAGGTLVLLLTYFLVPPVLIGVSVVAFALGTGNSMNDVTRLQTAAIAGNRAEVESVLAEGVDVNAAGEGGGTALHWAALMGHVEVVKLLTENGAEVNAKNVPGDTPLHLAAAAGQAEVAAVLIVNGADVNARNTEGATPLRVGQAQGREEVVRLLREHGARE